jgi:hypothetical protein
MSGTEAVMVVQVVPQGSTIVFDGNRKTEEGFCAVDASIQTDSSNKSRLRNIGIWISEQPVDAHCVSRLFFGLFATSNKTNYSLKFGDWLIFFR